MHLQFPPHENQLRHKLIAMRVSVPSVDLLAVPDIQTVEKLHSCQTNHSRGHIEFRAVASASCVEPRELITNYRFNRKQENTMQNQMKSALSPVDQRMMAGIYSVDQAGTMLDCEPIAVKRLIALGRLPDNRNSKGSVVLKSHIEQFLGQGSPDSEMPPVDKTWFTSFHGEVGRIQFAAKIKAAAESLAMPTDKQLVVAFNENRRAACLSFNAKPTAAMKAAFMQPTSVNLFASGETTLTVGVVALISQLRSAADRQAKSVKPVSGSGFNSAIDNLYDTPEQFRSITEKAMEHALAELAVTFSDSRQIEGRSNPMRINTVVSFTDLSSTPQRDIDRAKQLAF